MLSPEQLEAWAELKDYQTTLKRLCEPSPAGLGLSLQDIAQAELDGVAPANAIEVINLPVVQQAIERISRARLAAALIAFTAAADRLSGLLEPLGQVLAKLQKSPQGGAQLPRAGK